jgi:hypothetical protein
LNANTPVPFGLAAMARLREPVEALPELRRCPGPVPPGAIPASFLKHSDEQTVFGLTAIFRAVKDSGLNPDSFRDWGVLAAPRFFGRISVGFHVTRFAAEGAWGVSPHVIPHRSLHALSGSVSQALKIHGPNFGVGGGPGSPVEVLLNAVALLHGQQLPGLWVVMTQMSPEVPPQLNAQPVPGTFGLALALALVPWSAGSSLPHISLSVQPGRDEVVTLERLLPLFEPAPGKSNRLALDQGGWLEVSWPVGPVNVPPTSLSSAPFPVETER